MKKICPECGEKISMLISSEVVAVELELWVDNEEVFIGDAVSGGWRCPVCGVVLFWEFEDAARFLECEKTYDI